MKTIKRAMVLLAAGFIFFISAALGRAALADSFNYTYTDATGISATGTLTGTLTAPGEYTLSSGTITLTGAPPCTNCGGLSGPLDGTGTLSVPPPQPFQVGGGTELIGLDNLFFPGTDPQLDTNGGLAFQMSDGLGIGIGGNGPGNYWIFGGNWSLNNNNGIFTTTPVVSNSCSLVSDTSDMVNGAPAALVATPYNPGWTASIPGASWIWDTPTIDNSLINESFTFTKTFVVSGTPTAAMLNINADNSYDVLLNGVDVASNPGETNYTIGSEGHFDIAGSLHDGTNTLATTVTNFGLLGSTPASNPAGLLYQLAITGATCSVSTSTPPAAPALKFIFANTTSSAVAGNGATFNVEAVDASGTIKTSFEQGVTLTVGGSGGGGGLVSIINGVGTSTVSDNIAETITLGLEDSQSTGLNVSSTASITFMPGPVTQLTLDHPGDMNENTRLEYTLGRKDQFGNLVSAGTTTAYLYSNSTSPDAAFFDAATGGNVITSTTIPDGSTSTQFWYYDDALESPTVTASDNPSAPDGAAGIIDASDTFTVAPGAVKFIFGNIPASTTVDIPVTFNAYAVDSSNTLYPAFNGGVTITTSGSATGGGLVTIVNGVGTTTVADATAESVTLGLRDTENTGLGVVATAQIAVNALPITAPNIPSLPLAGEGPSSASPASGIEPGIVLTFSGMAYPGASVMVIRKDIGTVAAPTTQAIPVATDGSFLITLNNVIRLTGQTYLLSFVDKNGLTAQTKAYNIPALDKLVHGNILAAPTLGFENASVITKNQPLAIAGYATPNATVELFIDGNPAGTVLVNNPSGEYTYTLSTDGLALGRHAVWAIQTYAQAAVEVSGYTNSLSQDEIFIDDSTIGALLTQNASGTYAFTLAASESEGGFRPVTVGATYTKQAESDFSNQESFTVSPLADPKLDLNGDGVVDLGDLSIFLSYLKNLNANLTAFHIMNPTIVKTLDFNGDGVVDIKDLTILESAIASSTGQ